MLAYLVMRALFIWWRGQMVAESLAISDFRLPSCRFMIPDFKVSISEIRKPDSESWGTLRRNCVCCLKDFSATLNRTLADNCREENR